jgi:hypothetical protein
MPKVPGFQGGTMSKLILACLFAFVLRAQAETRFFALAKIDEPSFSETEQGKPHRCSEYFFAFPAVDEHGPLINYIIIISGDTKLPTITERDQFRVIIDNNTSVPKVAASNDPNGIEGVTYLLRLNITDYQAARACLPGPSKN